MDIILFIVVILVVVIFLFVNFYIISKSQRELRGEMENQLTKNRDDISLSFKEMQSFFEKNVSFLNESQKERLEQMSREQKERLQQIGTTQNERLEQMTKSQLERLQQMEKSQNERLDQLTKTQQERLFQLDKTQNERLEQMTKSQQERLQQLDKTQNEMVKKTDEKLENIRVTVEEKLDKTLSERLGKSFETVGKQLNDVQQGLGEMKNLAQDVGGLKRVLSNVKMRGGLGEVQLQMLLENILAPDQYQANVIPKQSGRDIVEFAVKLPGASEEIPFIWLPVDAKFPKDVYEKLQNAYDIADPAAIEFAQKELDAAIKLNAKEISSKYVEPPYTTNFAIMFLPFEGIYAEVVRKAELLEYIQKTYNVIITGPTTFAAILNSLQMGFKTLAIQKRSGEISQVLSAVKTEFDSFGGLLEKAKTKIQGGLDDMDTMVGRRTRAIQRKLRTVESLGEEEAKRLLGTEDISSGSENDE